MFEKSSRVYCSRVTGSHGNAVRRGSSRVRSRSMLQLQLRPPFRDTYSGIMLVSLLPELRLGVDKNAEQAASFAMPTFFRIGCVAETRDLVSHVGFFDEFRAVPCSGKILASHSCDFFILQTLR